MRVKACMIFIIDWLLHGIKCLLCEPVATAGKLEKCLHTTRPYVCRLQVPGRADDKYRAIGVLASVAPYVCSAFDAWKLAGLMITIGVPANVAPDGL